MEFNLVYNEIRTDQGIKDEPCLKENFVRVEVFSPSTPFYAPPSLIKVSHGYNGLEDWSTRWIFSHCIREQAIRHAIWILDEYKLGQLCSAMEQWNEHQD